MTLWRQVLAALNDDSLDDATREEIIARGAAQLATRRTPQGVQATPDDVMRIAFEEFSTLLAGDTARKALRQTHRQG
ncbi:hypothetical protein J7E91_31605 [Streptomyces sp. ISL-99]|uniref:hypothetical protein n=1 Tax=Streptomyces sp. ISL-99 TaxID=2819193 RepID=UPI001BE5FFBD|nr:hypothetical protein [Streptomyces sp. ISL-99]MBT2529802.1 hypothetical protein [Streptomyces sp. ISL-99]